MRAAVIGIDRTHDNYRSGYSTEKDGRMKNKSGGEKVDVKIAQKKKKKKR